MSVKSELRKKYKTIRKNMNNKSESDSKISELFLKSDLYKNADTILCYVSLPDEVNTDVIIEKALLDKKCVAVPYCTDHKGNMQFYIINSLDELKAGSYGIREPDNTVCKKLENFEKSVIIVPALCFDNRGYRLGYGGGYYDRFLQNYPFISIGLCYNRLMVDEVPVSQYDRRVNYIITQEKIIECVSGGKNG